MMDVLQAPYITAARSRGLNMNQTVVHHGIRNGAMPVVTLFALWLAGLLGGSVVVEVIFVYPGMGQYLVDHVTKRDVPVVQAVGLVFAAVYISLNIIADIAAIVANPRLRHPK